MAVSNKVYGKAIDFFTALSGAVGWEVTGLDCFSLWFCGVVDCISPVMREVKDGRRLLPGIFVSNNAKKAIREKFRQLEIRKRRILIKELAQKLNPIIRGLINYYHKFWQAGMRPVWNDLNHRLLKWVKWEKGLYKYASVRWLKRQYRESPDLFEHWKSVQP